MKKTLYLLAILAFLVPSLSFASFDISLKYGSTGDAVSELQDFLQDQNFYTGKVDGKFGLGTRKAVIAFQTANELSPDGYFGMMSRTKASELLAVELKPSLDAEVAETGGVSAPVMDGCTSTAGFSVTTGKKCDGTFTPAQVADTGTQAAINSLSNQVSSLTQQLQNQSTQTPPPTVTPPVITPPVVTPPVVQTPPPYVEPVVSVSLLNSQSTPSQSIISTEINPAVSKITFNATATGTNPYISSLKFSVTENTVQYMEYNHMRFYPKDGIVELNNLGIVFPNGNKGNVNIIFDIFVTYNSVGTNGLISNTPSKITLTYYGYGSVGTDVSIDAPVITLF